MRDAIVAEALTWRGVPFLHQGRTRAGVDCIGLGIKVGEALGLIGTTPHPNYIRNADGKDLMAAFRATMGRRKLIDQAEPGDVFLIRDLQFVIHVAICIDLNPVKIIHAHYDSGQVIVHRPDQIYDRQGRLSDRLVVAYPYPGVA